MPPAPEGSQDPRDVALEEVHHGRPGRGLGRRGQRILRVAARDHRRRRGSSDRTAGVTGTVAGVQAVRVVVGVSGGIAAYKAADLVRALMRRGGQVTVVLTANAQRFITPI